MQNTTTIGGKRRAGSTEPDDFADDKVTEKLERPSSRSMVSRQGRRKKNAARKSVASIEAASRKSRATAQTAKALLDTASHELSLEAAYTPISLIMSLETKAVRSSTDLATLRRLLEADVADCGLPVVDEREKLEGYVFREDVSDPDDDIDETSLRVSTENGGGYELGEGWHAIGDEDVTAGDVMRTDMPKLQEKTSIIRAAAAIAFEGLHHLPVVASDNTLLGVVSAHDVLEWFAQTEGYLMPSYPIRAMSTQRDATTASDRSSCVLVADDDIDMRRMVAHALHKDGCYVIEVADGAELLDYLGSCMLPGGGLTRPDVIISDIRMPEFSGLEILAGLSDVSSSTPVILITALEEQEIMNEAARSGAAAIFRKPFDFNQLRRTVREMVGAA